MAAAEAGDLDGEPTAQVRGLAGAWSKLTRLARGTAVEVGWVTTHLATYPLGLRREPTRPAEQAGEASQAYRMDTLGPRQRGLLVGNIEAARTPILFVHGIIDNHSVFAPLRHALHRRGFAHTRAFSYPPLPNDLREPAAELADVIEQLCTEAGFDRIHVVGHSMGGLIARYAVQRLGMDGRVHTLVTLGTPHQGTVPARLVPHPLLRQLRPGSPILAELAEPAPGCRTRFVSVWSDFDAIVHPSDSAELHHRDLTVRNVRVSGVGHLSLPIHGEVVNEISATLAALDEPDETTDQRPNRADPTTSTRSSPDSGPTSAATEAP